MWIRVVPAGDRPFMVELDAGSEIEQLKVTIESTMMNQIWRAASMSLFYGNVELENNSTILNNHINELATLHAVPYADQYQGTMSSPFPAYHNMLLNYGDDHYEGDLNLNLDDLWGTADAPPADVRLILPPSFQANAVLNFSSTHHFHTSGQLRDKIESDPPAWLPKLEAYAILSNANVFLAENVDDVDSRRNGAVALVRSMDYGYLHQGRGYKLSNQDPTTISVEKPAGKWKISGEITLHRYEIADDVWTRRRVQFAGDDTFSLIQWIATVPKKKDTVKQEVSTAVKAISDLTIKLDTVATDVSDMKNDMASVKQSLTDIQTTLTALADRLPQHPPPDN